MEEWKDQCIVLRIGHFHECDLWLKLFLKSYGVITAFAFGGAKSKKRFCGCLDILNCLSCRIRLTRSGQYHILEEASLISAPTSLRENWRRMGIMANCLKFMEAVPIPPESAQDCYELLKDMRDTLAIKMPASAQLFFRFKLANILGFSANFASCAECGAAYPVHSLYMPADGAVLCDKCSGHRTWADRRYAQALDEAALRNLVFVQEHLPHDWPDDLSATSLRQCGRAIETHIQFHMGLEWNNGDFRKI